MNSISGKRVMGSHDGFSFLPLVDGSSEIENANMVEKITNFFNNQKLSPNGRGKVNLLNLSVSV